MSFTNLENRFTERVNKLYGGATTKFDGGLPSSARTAEPYILRRPGDSQRGLKLEGRGGPVISAANDIRRLSLFQTSPRGLIFLAKQQLLQTGNTFSITRIVNPVFVVANAIPFTHVQRHLNTANPIRNIGRSIVGGLLGQNIANRLFGSGKPTNIVELRKIAQLQQETYDKFVGADPIGSGIKNALKKVPILGKIISAVSAKRSMGEVGDGWKNSRPELGKLKADYFIAGYANKIKKPNNPNATAPLLGLVSFALAATQTFSKLTTFKYGGRLLTSTFNGVSYGPINKSSGLSLWLGGYAKYLADSSSETDFLGLGRPDEDGPANGVSLFISHLNAQSPKANQSVFKVQKLVNKEIQYVTNERFRITPTIPDRAAQNTDYTSYGTSQINKRIRIVGNSQASSYEILNISENYRSSLVTASKITEKYKTSSGELISSPGLRGLTQTPAPSLENIIDSLKNQLQPVNENFVKYFTAMPAAINSRTSTNARDHAEQAQSLKYVKDPLNSILSIKSNTGKVLKAYDILPQIVEGTPSNDIITVSFAMGNNNHVQFRAFLSDLTQDISPQYKQYQYIGRMEKFIAYTGVQRDISFKLRVVAFGQDELSHVWTRINYLTGLTFPYGFNNGIYQPNIVRITIGNVYKDQPGYITVLNTNFSEAGESWEIVEGQQVPIAATMSMRFTLIEKNSKTAGSPFYNITENLTNQFATPAQRSVATTQTQPPDRSAEEGTTTPAQQAERRSAPAVAQSTAQTGGFRSSGPGFGGRVFQFPANDPMIRRANLGNTVSTRGPVAPSRADRLNLPYGGPLSQQRPNRMTMLPFPPEASRTLNPFR